MALLVLGLAWPQELDAQTGTDNAEAVAINAPSTGGLSAGHYNIEATFQNNGATMINQLEVRVIFKGNDLGVTNYQVSLDTIGGSAAFSRDTLLTVARNQNFQGNFNGVTDSIEVQIVSVNGNTDDIASPDTLNKGVKLGLNGTVRLGGRNPDFTTA